MEFQEIADLLGECLRDRNNEERIKLYIEEMENYLLDTDDVSDAALGCIINGSDLDEGYIASAYFENFLNLNDLKGVWAKIETNDVFTTNNAGNSYKFICAIMSVKYNQEDMDKYLWEKIICYIPQYSTYKNSDKIISGFEIYLKNYFFEQVKSKNDLPNLNVLSISKEQKMDFLKLLRYAWKNLNITKNDPVSTSLKIVYNWIKLYTEKKKSDVSQEIIKDKIDSNSNNLVEKTDEKRTEILVDESTQVIEQKSDPKVLRDKMISEKVASEMPAKDSTEKKERKDRTSSKIELTGKSEKFKDLMNIALYFENIADERKELKNENKQLKNENKQLKEEKSELENGIKDLREAIVEGNKLLEEKKIEVETLNTEIEQRNQAIAIVKADKVESAQEDKKAITSALKIYFSDYIELKKMDMSVDTGHAMQDTLEGVFKVLDKYGIRVE